MTSASERERFEDLYDVERHVMATDGGILVEDPYPAFAELLDAAPVHEGSVRELLGYPRGGLSLLRDAPDVLRALVRGQRHRAAREPGVLVDVLRRAHDR